MRPAALLCLPLLIGTAAAAEIASRFTHQAPIVVAPPGGLVRLELPAAVLAECRADLGDLRVLDPAGREVPYLVESGPAAEPAVEREVAVPELVDVRREERQREGAPPLHRETYRLAVADVAGDGWELVVDTARAEFVRRLDVSIVEAAGTSPAVENGSVFRLQRPLRERTRVPIAGPVRPAGLVVALEGEDGGYLDPTFRLERLRAHEPGPRIRVPLVERARHRERGRTAIELERPPGLVPDRIVVATDTVAFDRSVEVVDVGAAGRRVTLGRGRIRRLEPGGPHEVLHVELAPARGAWLRLEVDDGDSPPLASPAVTAEVRRPALVLALASSDAATPAGTLYFGGGRVERPAYDLAGLAPLFDGSPAAHTGRIGATVRVGAAVAGEVRPNPDAARTPALDFAMRPAAPLDTRLWERRRRFAVQPSAAGVTVLRLAAEDLARARSDLADVRVVDAEGRQWPYWVASEATTDVSLAPPAAGRGAPGRSRYDLPLPVAPLPLVRLELDTDARFFARPYRLRAVGAEGERPLASGRFLRRGGEDGRLAIAFPAARVERLVLEVDDGDEAALAFTRATAVARVPELLLVAPPATYALLVGNPDARAPVYELGAIREAIAGARGVPAVPLEPAGPNPDYSAPVRATSDEGVRRLLPQVALWAVLLVAVVALAAVTLRVARREPS